MCSGLTFPSTLSSMTISLYLFGLYLWSVVGAISQSSSSSSSSLQQTYFSHFQKNDGVVSSRIVNGQDAPPDRYPYFVALFDKNDNLRCGGTLIAPNIVLSAAHCQVRIDYVRVGYYTSDPAKDVSEKINITGRYPNPLWVFELYSYDQMILVMETTSNKQPLKINLDPTIPETNITTNAILIGLGDMGGWGTSPIVETATVLQEINITFLDNDDCESVQNVETGELIFFELIKDDMICVQGVDGNNEGQCSGDSGGPYIIPGTEKEDPTQDIQIGIVSWSYGGQCPSDYPSVGSRTSVFEWIRLMTCQYASPPPDYMNCNDDSITFSPAPTVAPMVPTISPAPSGTLVTITLSFYFDDYPHELSWRIIDARTQDVMLERPTFYYPRDMTLVRETMLLSPGEYTLTIEDSHGDGIGTSVNDATIAYDIVLTNPLTNTKFLLLERPGDYSNKRTETFQVPSVEEYPTGTPSSAPSLSAVPTLTMVDIYLTLDFDDWYKEIGWSLYDADDPTIIYGEVRPGEYTTGGTITEEIPVPYPGGTFVLEVVDTFGDGLVPGQANGYYAWVPDIATGEQIVLVEGSDEFQYRSIHNFTLPELTTIGSSTQPNKTIQEEMVGSISDVIVEKRGSGDR